MNCKFCEDAKNGVELTKKIFGNILIVLFSHHSRNSPQPAKYGQLGLNGLNEFFSIFEIFKVKIKWITATAQKCTVVDLLLCEGYLDLKKMHDVSKFQTNKSCSVLLMVLCLFIISYNVAEKSARPQKPSMRIELMTPGLQDQCSKH